MIVQKERDTAETILKIFFKKREKFIQYCLSLLYSQDKSVKLGVMGFKSLLGTTSS